MVYGDYKDASEATGSYEGVEYPSEQSSSGSAPAEYSGGSNTYSSQIAAAQELAALAGEQATYKANVKARKRYFALASGAAQEAYARDIEALGAAGQEALARHRAAVFGIGQETRMALGSFAAASAAGGVSGKSIGDAASEFDAVEAMAVNAQQESFKALRAQLQRQAEDARARAQSRIYAAVGPTIAKPNYYGRILGAAKASASGFGGK